MVVRVLINGCRAIAVAFHLGINDDLQMRQVGFLGVEVEAARRDMVLGAPFLTDSHGPSCGPSGLTKSLPCHSLHTRRVGCLLCQRTRGTGRKFLSRRSFRVVKAGRQLLAKYPLPRPRSSLNYTLKTPNRTNIAVRRLALEREDCGGGRKATERPGDDKASGRTGQAIVRPRGIARGLRGWGSGLGDSGTRRRA